MCVFEIECKDQTAPNLLNNESLDEMFNVILVRQKVKVTQSLQFIPGKIPAMFPALHQRASNAPTIRGPR
jgi:hypothetical protein